MNKCVLGLLLFTIAHIASTANANQAPPVKHPELRLELLRRAKADQDARGQMTKWMQEIGRFDPADQESFEASLNESQQEEFKRVTEKLRNIDEENTARLEAIVDKIGWPTRSVVGADGAFAAWLLVQHADRSPKLQRRCLDLMSALPPEEVSQSNVALLTDRVLLAEGKKQRYGTQFTLNKGKYEVRPLEDAANVDKRRAEVGLPPLAEYIEQIKAFYGPSATKTNDRTPSGPTAK